jgi:hypothetical protein
VYFYLFDKYAIMLYNFKSGTLYSVYFLQKFGYNTVHILSLGGESIFEKVTSSFEGVLEGVYNSSTV